ncbi:MAG TPA: hypothetical protein VHU42_08925 [Rhodopila sp.]|jgi:hypothetical protein|nr:hypothetical protein [Rhodopila sp.]
MSQPAAITAAFLDKILTLLAPLFLAATGGDMAAARDAVRSTLANSHARTDAELRLTALVIAFGFGALDALGKAVDPDLSVNQVLRLRTNATALSRASHQNQAVLDRMHKAEPAEPAPEPELAEPDLPASIETEDLVSFTRAIAPARTQPPAPLTRQQRRAAERADEKAKRQHDYQVRRAALLGLEATRQ